MLRIPRTGGEARVFAYPRLDTVVWNGAEAPAPARVLAFDEEAGIDRRSSTRAGSPARIDFRQGAASTVTKTQAHGTRVERRLDHLRHHRRWRRWSATRRAARGSGSRRSPRAPSSRSPTHRCSCSASAAAARSCGACGRPARSIADSVVLPRVDRALRTQVGDLLYPRVRSASSPACARARMQRTASVAFDEPVELLAATPSGDRVFVVTSTGTSVQVVDRYRERSERHRSIWAGIRPTFASIRSAATCSRGSTAWTRRAVIALGTNHVVGTLATGWRADLPFVAPDGGIALAQGQDVIVADGDDAAPDDARARRRGGLLVSVPLDGLPSARREARRAGGLRRPAGRLRRRSRSIPPRRRTPRRPPAAPAPAPHPRRRRATPPCVARPRASRYRSPRCSSPTRRASSPRRSASAARTRASSPRCATARRSTASCSAPIPTREEAERIGRESKQSYWIYEGGP